MNFKFEKVEQSHLDIIFSWLDQDVIKEFWDNTQAHKDDIINFVGGRNLPSSYADGKYIYWIASLNDEPFAMIMTIQETHKDDICQEKIVRLSRTGNTYGLDYMIGNLEFFGKGYGATTLMQFMDYFRASIDPKGFCRICCVSI